jgi:polyisoprenoid-binding protein YceI
MHSRVPGVVVAVGALLLPSTAAVAKTFKIDKAHTSVTFRVGHLFSTVTGRFTDFDGQITFDDAKPLETKVVGSIAAASINTDNEKRDNHLRSADFFDVEKFPTITFSADKVTDVDQGAHKAKLHGTLTMHGVSRPIVLESQFLGAGKDPWGNAKAGFRGTTRLNRKDFGLSWNQALETGGVLVGEEIEIVIDVEAGATE